jgi:sulfite reductase (ferredoxin)
VPKAVKTLTDRFVSEKQPNETFQAFVQRIGKKEIRKLVDELSVIPTYEQDPSYYSDWGDPREYTIGDLGVGECAGEVVPLVQVGLADSEREVFEAQLLLDEHNTQGAADRAFSAMVLAAQALTREKNSFLGEGVDEIVTEFRAHYYDTKLFFDPFAGGKFAHYFFRAYEHRGEAGASAQGAHQLIEEAQLFVEAAHQCYTRIAGALP